MFIYKKLIEKIKKYILLFTGLLQLLTIASMMKKTSTTTKMTPLSQKDKEFMTAYIDKHINENYAEPDSQEEKEQIQDIKTMMSGAMTAMAEYMVKNLPTSVPSDKGSDISNPELSELLSQVKLLTAKANQQPAATVHQPVKKILAAEGAASSSGKGTHNVSAYTMWAKHWRTEHPKQNPPAGLWDQQCKADPTIKAHFQELADEFNQAEGRVSTKGTTRASTGKVSGYTQMQKRLGELNALLPEGSAKISCSDQTFKACKVLGADKKVIGDASITKLEEWFKEEHGIEIE